MAALYCSYSSASAAVQNGVKRAINITIYDGSHYFK
jgi:hypothetical protein